MTTSKFTVRPEMAADTPAIDTLVSTVFGPGMLVRAAYVLREGIDHNMDLSFVATSDDADGKLIGTVRLTKVRWGEDEVWMLGPLAVLQQQKGKGAGKALMHTVVAAARDAAQKGGLSVIVLVGDLEYYAQFGFTPVAAGKAEMPRPTDPGRILVCDLLKRASNGMKGLFDRSV